MRLGIASLLILAAAGCNINRVRPGPPFVSLQLQDSIAPPLDTIRGFIQATSVEGLDSIFFGIRGGPSGGVDGRFEPETAFFFELVLDSTLADGDSAFVFALARDLRTLVSQDSQLLVITTSP